MTPVDTQLASLSRAKYDAPFRAALIVHHSTLVVRVLLPNISHTICDGAIVTNTEIAWTLSRSLNRKLKTL